MRDCGPEFLPTTSGECERIGVPERGCGDGFAEDPDAPGGCHPLLPDCQGGPLLGVLNQSECLLPSGCGERVVFPERETVWALASATEPFLGTRDQPYKTISDAIAATQAGWRIHVLSGRYEESVRIPHQLELVGICPQETQIAGAALSLAHAVIDGCGESGALVSAGGERISGAETALCRCKGRWLPCAVAAAGIDAALIGFGGCNEKTEYCRDQCFTDLISAFRGSGNAEYMPQVSVWRHGRDDVASTVTDVEGCGVFPNPVSGFTGRGISTKVDYTPAIASPSQLGPDFAVAWNLSLAPKFSAGAVQRQIQRDDEPDLRNAVFVSFQVCDPPPEAPLTHKIEVCTGHGVAGVRAELVGGTPPHNQAYFPSATNSFTDPKVREMTLSGSGYFYNVPPGEYMVRLLPPERTPAPTLACDLDPLHTGSANGIPVEGEQNAYRVRVEPGFNTFVARAFCTLK